MPGRGLLTRSAALWGIATPGGHAPRSETPRQNNVEMMPSEACGRHVPDCIRL